MEKLRSHSHSHSHRKEQRAVAAQSKDQHSRAFNVLKSVAATVSSPYPSPPSTPSPTHPFVHLDSTSTASLSHLAPRSHLSAQQLNPQHTTTESDVSSASASHAASPHHEVPIENVSTKRVSLEQHLQHGDAGREEAMQSFILERFLPAAKTVAADHNRTVYSAGRHPIAVMSSTIRHSSSTMKAAPLHSNKSTSTLDASKNVTWSRPLSHDDEGDDESVDSEMAAKSCGFLCAGLKSAMPRTHNLAHTTAQTVSRNKSRATQSSSHGTSSDEDDLPPKVKVMMQGTRKQRGPFLPAPISFTSSSPTAITIEDAPSRRAARMNKSFARDHAGNPVESHTHLNSRPLLNLCIKCHSSSSLHQPSMKELPSHDGISSRQSAQTLRCVCPCDEVGDCHDTQKTPGELNANDYCLWKASNPSEGLPSQADDIKESLAHHSATESALRDRCCPEDGELEFYDALSRFDTSISTQSNVPPLQGCELKSQEAPVSVQILTSDEHNLVENHLPCIMEGEILAFNADHEIHVEVPRRDQSEKSGKEKLMVQQKCRSNSRHGNRACAQRIDGAYSSISNSCHEYKKSLSSPVLGWPLGISSFQSGTRKVLAQETKNFDDECAANTKFQFAKMAEEQWTHDGRLLTNSNIVCTNNEEGTKPCKKCVANTRFSSDVLAPPVPPSSTSSSWLGKALALKASKPSYLATLQEEEKVVSAQKKLEFTLPLDGKKQVRWEDVVKGSQMHPEHFSFSEEICHHQRANQNVTKPLTL